MVTNSSLTRNRVTYPSPASSLLLRSVWTSMRRSLVTNMTLSYRSMWNVLSKKILAWVSMIDMKSFRKEFKISQAKQLTIQSLMNGRCLIRTKWLIRSQLSTLTPLLMSCGGQMSNSNSGQDPLSHGHSPVKQLDSVENLVMNCSTQGYNNRALS